MTLYSDNLVNLTSFWATMYSKKETENLMNIPSYIAKISKIIVGIKMLV